MDCFSDGSEPIEYASPVPATKAAIAIVARYSILMAMVPPSTPRTNRTSRETVPRALFNPSLGTSACAPSERHPRRSVRAVKWVPIYFHAASSSMRRLGRSNCSLFRPTLSRSESGNESSGQYFGIMRRRSPLNYTAHVADSQRFLPRGPLFSKTSARTDSQKRRLRFHSRIASRARKRESCVMGAPMLALSYPNEASYAQPH